MLKKSLVNVNGYTNSDDVMRDAVLVPALHGNTNSMFVGLHETIEEFIKSNT